MSILFPDCGELEVLGRRSAAGGQGPDRLPARGARALQEDEGRRRSWSTWPGSRAADGPDLRRRVRHWLERVDLAEVESKRCEELSKGMQQKVQFVAALHPRARPAHPRRALQRPRPGQPAAAARPGARGAPPRRHRALLDPRHGAGRAALRPRDHDPPRRQGPRRDHGRRSAPASTRGPSSSSPSTPGPTSPRSMAVPGVRGGAPGRSDLRAGADRGDGPGGGHPGPRGGSALGAGRDPTPDPRGRVREHRHRRSRPPPRTTARGCARRCATTAGWGHDEEDPARGGARVPLHGPDQGLHHRHPDHAGCSSRC